MIIKTVGCLLSVELTSNGGHKIKWDSQPVVKQKPQRNLFLSAAIVFAGNTFTAINQLASCFNLQFSATHRKNHCSLLVTRHGWLKVGGKLRFSLPGEWLILMVMVVVTPGHSSKYGTHNLMDEDIYDVVTFQVVQVTEV